jgi:hypothetical protein
MKEFIGRELSNRIELVKRGKPTCIVSRSSEGMLRF